MKTFILLILTSAAMISSVANSATVTSQVQKMSYASYDYQSGCYDEECDSSYTVDYSADDLFYTFTATWDDVSSILNITVSDGNNVQFTDGYYDDGYDPDGNSSGYSESESVSINVTNGQITSFNAFSYYDDYTMMSYSNTSWSYDGNSLIRQTSDYDDITMYDFSATLTYDVLNPSAIPLPAGVWLFGSALAGLGVLRKKK